jgi:hypothetical protein
MTIQERRASRIEDAGRIGRWTEDELRAFMYSSEKSIVVGHSAMGALMVEMNNIVFRRKKLVVLGSDALSLW